MSNAVANGASTPEFQDLRGQLAAIHRSFAVIEFELDGTILQANDNFLSAVGYTAEEVRGRHHSMFMPPGEATRPEYAEFWRKLGSGEFAAGEFKRVRKDGQVIWIQASYSAILDDDGKPFKVVKYASDITAQKLLAADQGSQIEAIGRVMAVIEFDLTGRILRANENFQAALGYRLDEIQGQHHRKFVEPEFAASAEYAEFWQRLSRGEYFTGEFKRLRKDGSEIWIQASYNPILDADGKPYKVVKFATDITQAKVERADSGGQIAAIHKSQAVIEFNLDGIIQTANENFLGATGYTLDEIRGKHHRIFMDPKEARSPEYAAFWAQLGRGEYSAGEYRRIAKGGDEIWIQASYNPILDLNGKPVKVVKYATDITEMVCARQEVTQTAVELGESSSELSGLSQELTGHASEASKETGAVAESASRVSDRMQTLASATEQMSDSITEIAGNVNSATDVAGEAVRIAESTNEAVRKLGDSSEEIGAVVKVITSIAQQTNLLALNATIEAARAGSAGKGFAVVANEVKELAKETAKATEDIGRKISAIQADTGGAVDAIGKIGKIIGQIDEMQGSIAGAIEQQTATTAEMARHVTEATAEVEGIGEVVKSVSETAHQSSECADRTSQSAGDLSTMSQKLNELVSHF